MFYLLSILTWKLLGAVDSQRDACIDLPHLSVRSFVMGLRHCIHYGDNTAPSGFVSPSSLNTDLWFPSYSIYCNPQRYLLFLSVGEGSGAKKGNITCVSLQAQIQFASLRLPVRAHTAPLKNAPPNENFRVPIFHMRKQMSREGMWLFWRSQACLQKRLERFQLFWIPSAPRFVTPKISLGLILVTKTPLYLWTQVIREQS